MKHRVVGDVSDFGKYGLLRFLTGMTGEEPGRKLSLGVVWYMNEEWDHKNEGKHISYLSLGHRDAAIAQKCDRELWERLGELVHDKHHNRRCVHCVEECQILPRSTRFHSAPIPFEKGTTNAVKQANAGARERWLNGALSVSGSVGLLFLDPDNGIKFDDSTRSTNKSRRYAYISEIKTFWQCPDSRPTIIVYHDLDQKQSQKAEAREVASKVDDHLGLPDATTIPLLLRKGSAPAFMIIPRPDHQDFIEERVAQFLGDGWGRGGESFFTTA